MESKWFETVQVNIFGQTYFVINKTGNNGLMEKFLVLMPQLAIQTVCYKIEK